MPALILKARQLSRQALQPFHLADTYAQSTVAQARFIWFNDTMPSKPFETTPESAESALEFQDARPPMSTLAILAGVMGLIFFIPWPPFVAFRQWGTQSIEKGTAVGAIGAVFAVILGVVAIFQTRQKRRRGRWFGITGCTLGLLGIGTQILLGGFFFYFMTSIERGKEAAAVLKSSASDRPAKASAWYESFASERFKVSTSVNEFEDWLEHVTQEHGQLQQAKLDKKKPFESVHSAIAVRLKGQFVGGMSAIEVLVGFDGGEAKIDDIRVGESSPLD